MLDRWSQGADSPNQRHPDLRKSKLPGSALRIPQRRTETSSDHTIPKTAMNIELPPVIAGFFHASNTREFGDFLSLFTPDAHVNDEENDHRGAEIAAWIDRATAEAKPTAEVTDITTDGERFVITAEVSGNFPGSPVQLRYHFTLRDNKITALLIKA